MADSQKAFTSLTLSRKGGVTEGDTRGAALISESRKIEKLLSAGSAEHSASLEKHSSPKIQYAYFAAIKIDATSVCGMHGDSVNAQWAVMANLGDEGNVTVNITSSDLYLFSRICG